MRILHALAIASTLLGYCGNETDAPPPMPEQATVVANPVEAVPDGRTVDVFTDFQCEYCKTHDETMRELHAHRPDVKVVIRHHPLPMHPDARLAAKAAVAAEVQEKGEAYARFLFEHQDDLSRDSLVRLAKTVGCDLDKFVHDMDSEATEERIVADEKMAKKLGIRATPTTVVGAHLVEGARPIADIERHLP